MGEFYLCQATINKKIRTIDKTTLIACEKDDSVGLFDSFAEATGWEVNLATVTLGSVVA